jgi:hypothetical protein
MVTTRVTGSGVANFYDKLTASANLESIGFAPGARFTIKAQATAFDGTDQIGFDVYFRHDLPDEQNCFHASWITPSGSPMQQVTGDFAPPPNGVEWTGTSGATGCLDFHRVVVVAFPYKYPGTNNLSFQVDVTYTPSTLLPAYCPYGTRAKSGTPLSTIVTPNTISAILDLVDAPWAVQAFAAIAGNFLDINELCGRGPASGVTIDMSTWGASAVSLWQTFLWASWWSYCECTPGTPAPNPPPQPSLTEPPAWPAEVVYSCDPSLICDTLIKIQQQLGFVQRTALSALEVATLVQRYRQPMAVIRGAVHSGLTQSGAFNISQLIGLEVTVSNRDPNMPTLPGQPNYLWDVGWMSVSELGGMIQEKRLTRQHQIWIPDQCAMADTFGYYLIDGQTIDVTELEAEP